MRLTRSRRAWGTPGFAAAFKDEVRGLDPQLLPLQQGLSRSSHVAPGGLDVMLIGVADGPEAIRVKAGIFYAGVIAGCSCADDPTPVDQQPEYCELQFDIDKWSAEAAVTLLPD